MATKVKNHESTKNFTKGKGGKKKKVNMLNITYDDDEIVNDKINDKVPSLSEEKPKPVTDEANMDLNVEFDRNFIVWLKHIKHSFIISSYKRSTIFSVGHTYNKEQNMDKISLWLNTLVRTTGLSYEKDTLWVAGSGQLIKYVDYGSLPSPEDGNTDFDITLMPKKMYLTSDVDIHDICVGDDNTPYFISTLYSCVCKPSEGAESFEVYWKPSWISKIAAEDRCHLNGLCSRDGKPRYVTSVSKSDVKDGWRKHRSDRGVVVDIQTDEILCSNLSMPHSPRWHNGKLWLLEAGTGYFGYLEEVDNIKDFEDADKNSEVEPDQPKYKFVKKTFIPGFLRGLSFIDDRFAIVCSSHDRHESVFQGLQLNKELENRETETKCGMHVINLESFDIEHNMVFTSGVVEIYDVVTVPNKTRPKLYDFSDPQLMLKHKIKN